jgi:hypothetical protein
MRVVETKKAWAGLSAEKWIDQSSEGKVMAARTAAMARRG